MIFGQFGDDELASGEGDDFLGGSRGDDRIRDLDGANDIHCHKGFDRVVTNEQSDVADGYEKVTRQ